MQCTWYGMITLLWKCTEEEISDLSPTRWGLFNDVTWHTPNHLKSKPVFGVANVVVEEMKKKTLLFITEYLNKKNQTYE